MTEETYCGPVFNLRVEHDESYTAEGIGVHNCTGDAGIGDLGTSPLFETLPIGHKYSLDQDGAYQLYSDEEFMDDGETFPPFDHGSYGLTCAKVLKNAGLISGYRHCWDADSALKALSVTPFMFGTPWFETMFDPDKDGRVHPNGPIVGGHEILCRELRGEQVWMDNSWGPTWGVDGRFYISVADFGKLLNLQGDVVILIPLSTEPGGLRLQPRRRKHHHHRAGHKSR